MTASRKNLSFLFFLIAFACVSQVRFNKAYHERYEVPAPFLIEISGDYYFITTNWDYNVGGCYLYKHDAYGQLVYRKPLPGSLYSNNLEYVIKTLDSQIVCIGSIDGCDIVDSTCRSYILKMDQSGNSVFLTKVKTVWYSPGSLIIDNFKTGLQHTDSSYYVFSDSVMYHFSKAGTYLSKTINFGITGISSALSLANNNILISGKIGNAAKLIEVNTSGAIITQSLIPVIFRKMELYGNQNVLGLNQSLYKVSSSYALLGNSSITGTLTDFVRDNNDTIYCIGNGNAPAYYKLDTALNPVFQSSTVTQGVRQRAVMQKNGLIGVLSDCNSFLTYSASNNYAGLNVFDKSQSNNFIKDIQVLRVEKDSVKISMSNGPGLGMTLFTVCLQAGVWIRNNSAIPVNSVKLNCYIQINAACGTTYFQQSFSGISLQPGDSVKLTTNWICKEGGTSPGYSVITEPFCLYSTVPDSTNDRNISNDGVCTTVSFNPDYVKENRANKFYFRVYPVPSANVIYLESDGEPEKAELFDVSGRLVKTFVLPQQRGLITHSFFLDNIQSGTYLLRISGNSQSFYRKVIKE